MNIRRHIDPVTSVAVLAFDRENSSANLFDPATLHELDDHLAALEAASGLRGVLLRSTKPSIWIAGADLHALAPGGGGDGASGTGVPPVGPNRGMGVPPMSASDTLSPVVDLGHAVFSRLAALPVPAVAVIHGVCLGGGLELALACDWRVASDDPATRLGLPETQLGILPAWGGSVRLPRLVGLPAALDLVLSGKRLAAKQALRIGLVDTVSHAEYLEAAALRLLSRGKRPAARPRALNLPGLRRLVALRARSAVLARTRGHYPAPLRAIEVCTAALGRPPADGFALEKDAFLDLASGPVARHLVDLFFQRERVKKSAVASSRPPHPPLAPAPAPHPHPAAVVGAGVMGAGIAQWLAAHGRPVRLQDVSPDALARGLAHIEKLTAEARRRHLLASVEARAALDRVVPIEPDTGLVDVDFVIEAAAEKLDVKQAIFRRLEARSSPDTILATNTSALSIDAIADGLAHPARVIGLHFFNPVHRMPLVEIVRGPRTSAATVEAARRLALSIDKLPVVVRDRPGFLVNRVLIPGLVEAIRLFRSGVPVRAIDEALLDFGLPMGPLRLADEVGLDIALHVARDLSERLPHLAAPDDTLDRFLARGWLGKKSGRGFYVHSARGEPRPNPELRQLRLAAPTRSGTAGPFRPATSDIADRVVLTMVNEAARCLDEGVAECAADIDFAMILGTGWAPFRGGPLHHADSVGLANIALRLGSLAAEAGPHLAPCPALLARAASSQPFFPEPAAIDRPSTPLASPHGEAASSQERPLGRSISG